VRGGGGRLDFSFVRATLTRGSPPSRLCTYVREMGQSEAALEPSVIFQIDCPLKALHYHLVRSDMN
jgi:hypothetical protein